MSVNDEQVVFNILKAMEYLETIGNCFAVNIIEQIDTKVQEGSQLFGPLEHILTTKEIEED